MTKKTTQIRILLEGNFIKLIVKITDQFEKKHGFTPAVSEVCESIAKAIEEKKLFG